MLFKSIQPSPDHLFFFAGTVPVNGCVIQTWDGIIQGERLLTMSCSDKMARWNIVGVQGSLLSHIIQPIYFSTIVVGNLYHQVHLRRALNGRINHLEVMSKVNFTAPFPPVRLMTFRHNLPGPPTTVPLLPANDYECQHATGSFSGQVAQAQRVLDTWLGETRAHRDL